MSESLQAHQEAKVMPGVSGTSDIGVLRGEGLCIRQIGSSWGFQEIGREATT
jgi:hypothetical protein